ncbi:hypothetical protein [Leucobacter sp. PH1c]|uniref:hypothetical protein n=1 Tax=Leucobacter sp. PH1c TaxID=1397278 RepID=UPI00056B7326|nr:hypothetical protein [Leucobacter sp. PH1c]
MELTTADAAMDRFDRQTSRYGSATMVLGLLLSLAGPFYLFFFTDLELSWPMVLTAFVAVAATFGVFWIVEPVTYYPILGSAAMYQAFMIGNISNKLLPAAIVAQSSIGAKPGSRRGDLASVMAICGAATVHLVSLLLFVGVLGSWLVSVIPAELIEVARLYILPSLMGAVLVQAIVSMKQLRPTIIAIALALLMQFVVVPVAPALGMFATAIVVLLSIVLSLVIRDRASTPPAEDEALVN